MIDQTPPPNAVNTSRPGIPSVDAMAVGLRAGDRAMLGRAITLVESRRADHRSRALDLQQALLAHAGKAHRIGITGVPGVGKSTFIEALGTNLTTAGHKVAVLAVDPSSRRTGGSILADKTRMARLSNDPNAFVRPSPTAGTLGGVARTTRETMLVCEAAGFDVILVETVGVGQSETTVADMVDFFLVLMLPGAGDELQGIKKGVLELADMIAVNKADGDNELRAKRAARDYANALHLVTPPEATWQPPVLLCSALHKMGLEELWRTILDHRGKLTATGEFQGRRRDQQRRWMWSMLEDQLLQRLRDNPEVARRLPSLERAVMDGRMAPSMAVGQVLTAFGLDP